MTKTVALPGNAMNIPHFLGKSVWLSENRGPLFGCLENDDKPLDRGIFRPNHINMCIYIYTLYSNIIYVINMYVYIYICNIIYDM